MMLKTAALRVLPAILVLFHAGPAWSTCAPFPCPDCFIESQGQLNFVIMDRTSDRIQMIPNMRFTGDAADFAVIVPTSGLPELSPADSQIWTDARSLTAPMRTTGSMDCDNERSLTLSPGGGGFEGDATDDSGVIIHGEHSVGAFIATILSSDSPSALVDWLNENNYAITEDQAVLFEPYVEAGWFFTAMRLDTSKVGSQIPPQGWNTDLDPVVFEYDGEGFELALPIISINRAPNMPVVFYVVDDNRAALDGFVTTYANRITRSELGAIAVSFPSLADLVAPGRFLTKLERTFTPQSAMNKSIHLKKSSTDSEFRRTGGWWAGSIPPELALLALPFLYFKLRYRRRTGVSL